MRRIREAAVLVLLLGAGACQQCTPGAKHECEADKDCSGDKACFASGGYQCACRPGLTLCGDQCVDIRTDPGHCGSCKPCEKGLSCERGACVAQQAAPKQVEAVPAENARVVSPGPSSSIHQVFPANPPPDPPGPTVTVDAPVLLSEYDPAKVCGYAAEPKPERSLNATFPGSPAALFSPFWTNNINSGKDWNVWTTAPDIQFLTKIPVNYPPPGAEGLGDAWSTTSGSTGLDYVSLLLRSAATGKNCLAIAASNPGLREINQWQYFPTCVKGTFDGADRPAIAFDTAGKTLWAAQGGPIAGMQLFVFQNCGAGSPGTSPCPMTKSIDVLGAVGHPGVAFDPCTHLGMLTYRTGDLAHLRFYKPDGTMVQDLALDVANEVPPQTNQGAWYQSTSCVGQNGYAPKCNQPAGACTGGQGCLRLASKIQIATQVLGGQCFAYLAYDISRLSRTDNKTYLHAALDVVNTTTAGAAVQVTGLRIGNDFVTWDSFGSNVAAADTPTASGAFPAGWYFYQEGGVTTQTDDPCHTYFEGIITTDHFVSTTYVQIAPVTFPAVAFPQYDGMGDYQGTLTRGLPQGILFPTWVQSVPMSSGSCVSCMGAQYSAGIYATRLHVP